MRLPSLTRLIVAVALSAASACGSSSSSGAAGDDSGGNVGNGSDTGALASDTATSDDATDDSAPGDDAIASAYPDGPYGIKTGDIMADFDMSGYLNLDPSQVSTAVDYRTLKLSDVRAAATVPYLFIHEVGFF